MKDIIREEFESWHTLNRIWVEKIIVRCLIEGCEYIYDINPVKHQNIKILFDLKLPNVWNISEISHGFITHLSFW